MSTQRLRADLTALLVMLSLILTNVLTPEEAFSAFGQPVIIILPALFIVAAALYETGVAALLAEQILRAGKQSTGVLRLITMASGGLLSAIISDFLVVTLFLPALLRVARRARIATGQLLIPLTTSSVMGGLLTLIGTVSTVVINDLLESNGAEPLQFFTLAPYGLTFLLISVLWYTIAGRRLLPERAPESLLRPSLEEVQDAYDLEEKLYQVRIRAGSDLVGKRMDEAQLGREYRLNVVAVQPNRDDLQPPNNARVLERDDILIVEGARGDVFQAATMHHLQPKGRISLNRFEALEQQSLRLAEAIVPFRSDLIGKTIVESRFRERYGLNILAINRDGRSVGVEITQTELALGDTLLVQGPIRRLQRIGEDLNLVLVTYLGLGRGDITTSKAWVTVTIVALMVAAVVLQLLSLATASLAAAVLLILSGCLNVERAYRSVDASILVVIGGMLPLAMALEQTGLAGTLAELIQGLQMGPFVTMIVVYAATVLLTQVISNTVTGVLVLPVALSVATAVSGPLQAYAITVIVGVTTSYLTPLTHGSNLMIWEPGGYEMRHYVQNNGPIFVLQSVALFVLLHIFYF
ncbi:MAG: SLC13 family permease [Chloroflexota bacterium]